MYRVSSGVVYPYPGKRSGLEARKYVYSGDSEEGVRVTRVALKRIQEHTFFDRFLGSGAVIVDLGTNVGRFAVEMTQTFDCYCYAAEPNPRCYEAIPKSDRIKAFNVAIAAQQGITDFYIADNSESSSLYDKGVMAIKEKVSVPTQRLEDFVRSLDITRIDLLKLDIEGAEIEVFDSLSDQFLNNISQITVEFHDFNGLVLSSDVERVVSRLNRLGFLHIHNTSTAKGHADTLFINRAKCPISMFEFLWTRYVLRNYLGGQRVLKRRLKWHQ